MDTTDSFEMKTTMSPKIMKKSKEIKWKPPTKLALKNTIRRSSIYDKLKPSVTNHNVKTVDATSTEGSSESNSLKSHSNTNKSIKIKYGNVIVISSSEDDNTASKSKKSSNSKDDCKSDVESASKVLNRNNLIPISNEHLSETKFESIKNWIEGLDSYQHHGNDNNGKVKVTAQNVTPKMNLQAKTVKTPKVQLDKGKKPLKPRKEPFNSTFLMDKTCLRFDKWMINTYNSEKKLVNDDLIPNRDKNLEQLLIAPSEVKINEKTDLENKGNNKKCDGGRGDEQDLFKNKEIKSPLMENNERDKGIFIVPKNDDRKKFPELINLLEKNNVNERARGKNIYGDKFKTKPKKSFDTLKTSYDAKKSNLQIKSTKMHDKEVKIEEKTDVFLTPEKQLMIKNDEIANILDNLYGNSWHKNRARIFSETKVRNNKPQISKLKEPRSEKTKQRQADIYINPYLDSEKQKSNNLLKELQQARIQTNLKSPFFARQNYFDDDSSPRSQASDRKAEAKNINQSFSDSLDLDDDLEQKLKKKLLPKPVKLTFNDDQVETKPTLKELAVLSSDSDSDFDPGLPKDKKNKKITSSSTSTSSTNSGNKRPTEKTDKNTDDLIDKLDNIAIDDSSQSDDDFIVKTQQLSFLASLSKNVPIENCNPLALRYKNNYKQQRDELARKLFVMYNEKIFEKCIPEDTQLQWNARMTGTAGACVCLKTTHRNKSVTRIVRLKLSTKVLDSADRLRDTLVHEMCHAATYIVHQINDGHGPCWKAFAAKAMKAFPELPPIKRCHDYAINYKYTYKCTKCGYSFGRHSKSLNLDKKRCGRCYGTFEVLVNKTSQRGTMKSVPCTPKKEATGFAKFIKENYALHKSPSVKHADLMKFLGRKYHELKGDQKL